MEQFKSILKEVLKNLDYKKILRDIYSAVRLELVKLVSKTDSKWDDLALEAVDYVVEKFLGDSTSEILAKQKLIEAAKKEAPVVV